LTVGYPLPRSGSKEERLYPSDYYSLPSVFIKRVPPPELHFHLRHFDLSDIPLGDLETLKSNQGRGNEGTEDERKKFDEWLLERWQEKDDLVKRFNETGSFGERLARQSEEEEEDRVRGEVSWKPSLTNRVSELSQLVGLVLPVLFFAAWGVPIVWKASRAVVALIGAATIGRGNGNGGAMRDTAGSCGCGKMGNSRVGNDRIEL
jgi:hypothetical protein